MSTSDNSLNFFSWETEFDATVIVDNCVYPNNYKVHFSFIPKNDSIQLQNIGFERVKYLFNILCENSVIFNPKDESKSIWYKMPINKILLPGSPYDQLLGVCLFHKIKIITNEFFHLGHLTIDSKLGDNVKYTVDADSFENKHLEVGEWVDADIPPWWTRDDTATFDQRINAKTYWTGAKSWKELGYEKPESTSKSKSFKPSVIDGGRDK